jgi:hypothetical protein
VFDENAVACKYCIINTLVEIFGALGVLVFFLCVYSGVFITVFLY